jgi:predicted NBD/HSP70 family sugar kinase
MSLRSISVRVFAAARACDVAAPEMLDERARYLGIALANLVNTFNPELIVSGGLLAHGSDLFLPVAEVTMRQRSFANLGE